jgi:translation initiation factor IF-3
MSTSAALRRAQSLGLDLVLVSPMAVPPVAKAIDYSYHPVRDEEEIE